MGDGLDNDPAMSEVPPPMPEVPKIPRGPLWICLLLPPLMAGPLMMMALMTAFASALGNSRPPAPYMKWWPGIMGILGFVTLVVFIVCLIRFIMLMNRRYSAPTVGLLSLGYVLGQIMVSFSICYGGCLILSYL